MLLHAASKASARIANNFFIAFLTFNQRLKFRSVSAADATNKSAV
jgi:hypothetical protein